jgi:hypothetical protein
MRYSPDTTNIIPHHLMLHHISLHDAARAERERMINEEKELCRKKLLETLKLSVDSDSAKGSSLPLCDCMF